MNKNITIVSAFFDIGRKNCNIEELSRSNEEYLSYFKMWARMKNKLVIFTEEKMKDKILKIREEFGLLDKTEVIVVQDKYSLEKDIYNSMIKIEKDENFKNFRYYKEAMSNGANYCYVMLLKYYALMEAERRGLIEDTAAWIDFGFNHGGKCYIDGNDFDYEWQYGFEDKITLFALNDPDKISIVDSLQLQKDCVMGALLIVGHKKCGLLYEYILEAINALIMIECIDDDQQLLLMAYKNHKEDFCIKISDWFMPLKEYGGNHLKIKQKEINPNKKASAIRKLYRKIKNLRVLDIKEKNLDFVKRSAKRCEF